MTPAPASPPPAPAKKSSRRLLQIGCGLLALIGLACGGLLAYFGWQASQQRAAYEAGHQAYEQGDCQAAQGHFERALSFSGTEEVELLIQKDQRECEAFQPAVALQEQGSYAAALMAYYEFVDQRPDSPLVAAAQRQSESLFDQVDAYDIVSLDVCQRLDVLLDAGLIPQPDDHLPGLYYECGQVFEAEGGYSEALFFYETFRRDYPDHALAEDVEAALVRATIAEAQAAGAGELPAPQAVSSGGSGPAVVVIQNDSPEQLSLVFSGPDVRVEELEPCADCVKFQGIGPEFCPEKGPIGRYTLPAGRYDVVVNSISDSGVTPFQGAWELNQGEEYYSCFFLVTSASP